MGRLEDCVLHLLPVLASTHPVVESWHKVLLLTYPCCQQPVHLHYREDAKILLHSVTCMASVSFGTLQNKIVIPFIPVPDFWIEFD